MNTVIFACIHNAGRSRMAAAWFNALADGARARVISAGTEPGQRVHPEVLEVMREVGIDLADRRPQRLTGDLARAAQLLITMGAANNARSSPGYVAKIGLSRIRRASPSRACARFATRYERG